MTDDARREPDDPQDTAGAQVDASGGPSRTLRSAQNASAGIAAQVLILLLSFVTRSVFIAQLGTELLGVHTLFLSILAIVAVADLGLGTAIMFALYHPIRSDDPQRIGAVVAFAGRLYRLVAIATAVIGLAVLPFLDLLVDVDESIPHLGVYYLVLLANTVLAFPLAHRMLLLEANQQAYVAKAYALAMNLARSAAQLVVLLVWHSFLAFLLVQVLATAWNNLLVHRRVGRSYTYLRTEKHELDPEGRRSIGKSVKAMVVYRVAGLVLNNTDPILISVLVGTVALGYYSNYLLIVGAFLMLAEVAFTALTPSVGNLVASGDKGAAERVLNEIALLAIWAYGTVAVMLLVVMDDFVAIWLGESFVLGDGVAVFLVLNFYTVGITMPILAFRGATGMFRETQYVLILTAVLNVGLSVVLGQAFGVAGVLAATWVARLMTNVWYEPTVLFRRHLAAPLKGYVALHLAGLAALAACLVLVIAVTSAVPAGWVAVLTGVSLSALTVSVALAAVFGRTNAMRTLRSRLSILVRRDERS